MKNSAHSTVWYGELRALKGNTIVIRDDQLPAPQQGRIYLYNTERDAIIQYDESIVAPKLFALDEQQRKEAEARFEKSWLKTSDQFMRSHRKFALSDKADTGKPFEEELLQDDDNDDDDLGEE
jgi:hypothetical protein